jgi:hypothetical protein
MVTVSRPTLRGFTRVPARLLSSVTVTDCAARIADATAVTPSAPTSSAAQRSAALRAWGFRPGAGTGYRPIDISRPPEGAARRW